MSKPQVGFIGTGTMGLPMALNLLRAGTPLTVWNRSGERVAVAERAGAQRAASIADVFATSTTALLMLANGDVIDEVLGRHSEAFAELVDGHLLVHMGTTSPEYSAALASDVQRRPARRRALRRGTSLRFSRSC